MDKREYNPFPLIKWNTGLEEMLFHLKSTLLKAGFDVIKNKDINNEMEWNPFVLDSNGNKIYYQRGFVWNIEEKRALLDSIYDNVSIGKVLLRTRGQAHVDNGGCYHEIVDGKQRLNTIIEFVQNKFSDNNEKYWKDFSNEAKRRFLASRVLDVSIFREDTTDSQILTAFIKLNKFGVPMEREHVDKLSKVVCKQ